MGFSSSLYSSSGEFGWLILGAHGDVRGRSAGNGNFVVISGNAMW